MEIIYISDDLGLKNHRLHYINNDNDKLTRIQSGNINKYLDNTIWTELDEEWNEYLLSVSDRKFSPYLLADCGGDGDCLFYCISEALHNIFQFPENMCDESYSVSNLRKLAANQINKDNFELIMETYKTEYEENELGDNWNPFDIKNIDELKEHMIQDGFHFMGDHIIIQLLQNALDMNIIVFNNYIFSENDNNISSLGQDINSYTKTIMLYYLDSIHFQLVGFFNGKTIQTVFYDDIPKEVLNLLNK